MKKLSFILCFLLFSCGFHEIKREDKIKNVVVIFKQLDENAFTIKKILEDKFETSSSPTYKLMLEKTESISGSGIGADAFTANFRIAIDVKYKLIEIQSGKVILTGKSSNYTNYISSRNNVISDFTVQKDSGKNLAESLGNKIYEDIQEKFGF
jgi:hypothetical protein